MKLLKEINKKYFNIFLYLFVFLAIVARFLFLGRFPAGLAHDELDMILSSRAIAFTGADISGVPFPEFFIKTGMEAKQTNLIPLLLSPYFRVVPLSLLTARLPFLLINLVLALGLYKLVKVFSKSRQLSLLVLLVFFINPWSFIFSRVTFAAPTALAFLIWGIYFLFRKKQKIKTSLLLFVLSSFCYMGALVITPLIAFFLYAYKSLTDKKQIKKYVFSFITLFAITAGYIGLSYSTEGGTIGRREGEISFLNADDFSRQVDETRRKSLEYPGKTLLVNKYTSLLQNMAKDYFNAFSTNSLFISGDPRVSYTFGNHGLLYWMDFVLVVAGLMFLSKKHKKLFTIVVFLAVVAPVGAVVNMVDYSIIYRAFPLMIVFVLLAAFGLKSLADKPYSTPILVLYFVSFLYFLHLQFLQYPVSLEQNQDFPERIAANFSFREAERDNRVVVAAQIPYHLAKELVFYGNLDYYTIPMLENYQIGNVQITNDCLFEKDYDVAIIDRRIGCKIQGEAVFEIQQQKDAGGVYGIYDSNLCQNIELGSYKRAHFLDDYSLERMDDQQFCNRWILKPPPTLD